LNIWGDKRFSTTSKFRGHVCGRNWPPDPEPLIALHSAGRMGSVQMSA
jgi:hypothetical protein